MNILVLAEYISHRPWAPDQWALALARALKARGHTITLACDGRDDASDLDGLNPIVRRPTRDRSKRQPMRFARWADQIRHSHDHDASISFTALSPGDMWAPVGPSEAERIRSVIRPNLLGVGLDLIGRPWIPSAAVAAANARLGRHARRAIRCRIGATTEIPMGLGFASLIESQSNHNRESVRRAIGLNDDDIVGLVSAVRIGSPGLDELFEGLSQLRTRGDADRIPVLVLIGHAQYTIMRRAARFGVEDHVRIIGTTQNIGSLLSACDAAIAPLAAPANATGRFIADSLSCGTPVLCAPDAAGAELLKVEHPAGKILPGRAAPEWRTALESLSNKVWLDSCAEAAAVAGATLTTDAIAERLERLLEENRR